MPTYHQWVFDEARRIGRTWYAANPSADRTDIEQLFEKIGEMAWRRLVDGKSLRTVVAEILAGAEPSTHLPPDEYLPPLTGHESGVLRVRGRDFVDEDGRPWPFLGYTMHTLTANAVRGQDLDPLFDEPIELGYNVIVTILTHGSPFKVAHGLDANPWAWPTFYEAVARLFETAERRRIRLAVAVWADLQHAPSGFDAQDSFRRLADMMRGRWHLLARKGNETGANGWDPSEYAWPTDMGGVLVSQGSTGVDTLPATPYLDWVEYEPRRDQPKALYDAGLGMLQIQDGDFAGPATHRPTVNIEPFYFHETPRDQWGDHRETDPMLALRLGLYSLSHCAGAAFGASESLECRRLGPNARRCAEAFVRGARGGFVR